MSTITINGRIFSCYAQTLSFHDVVNLAGMEGDPSITVRVPGHEGYILVPGRYVTPVEGQVFNVSHTTQA